MASSKAASLQAQKFRIFMQKCALATVHIVVGYQKCDLCIVSDDVLAFCVISPPRFFFYIFIRVIACFFFSFAVVFNYEL